MLLAATGIASTFSYWVALFTSTSLPGNRMYAGLAYGLAEGLSSILAGFLCKYFKDTLCYTGSVLLTMSFQLIFFFVCGGVHGSFLATCCVFGIVMGVGLQYCIFYLLIGSRVPPEKLGSSLCLIFTLGHLFATLATYVSYLPQPVPFVSTMICLLITLVLSV